MNPYNNIYIQYIAMDSASYTYALKVSVFIRWQQFMSYLHIKGLFSISHYLKKDGGNSDK